jgi:hypothetical protein
MQSVFLDFCTILDVLALQCILLPFFWRAKILVVFALALCPHATIPHERKGYIKTKLHIEMIKVKAFRTFIRICPLFKSE